MDKSRIIKDKFININDDELLYREKIQPKEKQYNDINRWIVKVNDGRRNLIPFLIDKLDLKGEILELGAGSCWLSSELSLLKSVKKIIRLGIIKRFIFYLFPRYIIVLKKYEEFFC